jgi:hypothetical protein
MGERSLKAHLLGHGLAELDCPALKARTEGSALR